MVDFYVRHDNGAIDVYRDGEIVTRYATTEVAIRWIVSSFRLTQDNVDITVDENDVEFFLVDS